MSNKKRRRKYTKDFKLKAVQLVEARDGNASAVARNLGLRPDLVIRWVGGYKSDDEYSFPALGKRKEPEEELYKLRKELADTKMERDILKKSLGHFLQTNLMKYRFIRQYRDEFPVEKMCRLFQDSRGSYYAWLDPTTQQMGNKNYETS